MAQDPRYWQQMYRRLLPRELSGGLSPTASEPVKASDNTSGGLWSENMGAGAFGGGAANYPAKYSFNLTTANCGSAPTPDYVVYSTGLTGTGTQASIVAFDNLYSGCTGTVPATFWAYNTGGQILTSPLISEDGTQVAFVQTAGGLAGLVILKWKASTTETVTSPGVPTTASSAAQYRTCAAPCMYEVRLHDGGGVAVDDTTSSPFYDYHNDIAWVGGARGWLHKITGVFKGSPTEATTGGFPVQVSPPSTNPLSSPVYDQASRNLFIGDAGGFFYRIASATGAVTASAQLDFGVGLLEGPLLDETNGFTYVFSSSDGTSNCTGGTACSAVYALSTSFGAGTSGSKSTVGRSVVTGTLPNPNPMYLGGLDSAYYNSVNGTGNLYVCGNTGSNPKLYRVPVTAGTLGTAVAIAGLTPVTATPVVCSPVTEFPNPNANVSKTELLFVSVQNHGRACANTGCVMNFMDLPWQPKTHYNVGQEVLVLRPGNSTLYINTAVVAGTTGTTAPNWPVGSGVKTVDGGVGGVTWLNQGATDVVLPPVWTANHPYGSQARIFDGTNIEISNNAGTSGAAAPSWNTTIGGNTTDNGVTWVNAGPYPSTSKAVTGGTGGIIIDNTSTFSGASQVYFFTLGNQLCTTSGGTGGCAMQASQTTLK